MLFFPLAALIVFASGTTARKIWLKLALASGLSLILYLVLRELAGAHLPIGPPTLLPVGLSFFQYFDWILLPFGLSVERSSSTPPDTPSLAALTALGLLLLAAALVFVFRKRFTATAAGLAWTALALLPFSGIVFLYQGMAERYVYLASAGIVFALVTFTFHLPPNFQKIAAAILLLWLAWGVLRLHARLLDWRNESALFTSSLNVTPHSAILPFNLAVIAQKSGQNDRAIALYRRALQANPRFVSALINLGNLLRGQAQYAAAISLDRRATSIDPRSPEAWLDLGNSYLQTGTTEPARDAYQQALRLDPHSREALLNLGAALQLLRDEAGAKQMYGRAIALDPARPEPYCDLGSLLLSEGDALGAAEQFDLAISKNPTYAPAFFDLGVLYQQGGNRDLARQLFQKTLVLDPHNTAARQHLAQLP